MRIGIIGTGAIARLHARAYATIGYTVRACTSRSEARAREFAATTGAELVASIEDLCRHPEVDVVDVCTLPNVRLEPVTLAARYGKHVQVQKPIATTTAIARDMIAVARSAGVLLHVVSQHRFDHAWMFLARAIPAGRLGRLVQADAYVKWHRTEAYYARPLKGTWIGEGGGALISQAIHQVDLLRWIVGLVSDVRAMWQLGATHAIEAEDVVSAVLRYANGATGVIQASTSIAPGYPERVELHGTKGTAIVTGDRLTAWDVEADEGETPPVSAAVASGASDPMAIAMDSFERQFLDFGRAIATGGQPLVAGEAGLQALEVVEAVYNACREEPRGHGGQTGV
jgi:UDP-N-acetyl-2-amino-2-deoxyglucuronate dehydrogenase